VTQPAPATTATHHADRLGAICGILGPAAFVGAWVVGGALTDGYDPTRDAISQLAREGAPTQPLMTSGLVVFGLLIPVWAFAVARVLDEPRLRISVTVAGLATVAVAVFPLTRDTGQLQDVAHAVSAGIGYVAMAVSPLLGALGLRRRGHRGAAALSALVAAVSACALVASVTTDFGGGFQRLGLTVVDAWYVVVATWVLRRTG
jgi:hypothetical membrane protein